uniref:Ysc84 actin-binding domain-containing protein n=1 Tax=Craspedostauros australis TaxID=1486917 RepID=A0A7R9ZM48_9STRA|mmetsp:Transcript_16153/g.44751  ORF Transcript_16153/g.44751 Transcript_16153/m.44751 type:complete len:219 (+) Transcript_16153:202-858(+)
MLLPNAHGINNYAALIGAQVSDHVFLLMTDAAVDMMFNGSGSVQLGADVGVAIGPVGRALEADFGASPGSMAPIYTYSLSKGFYAGVSLDGKILTTRHRVNERFYGRLVSGAELLSGSIPTPPAARPLYDALTRCHVYASGSVPNLRDLHGGQYNTNNINTTNTNMNGSLDANGENAWESEYGEVAGGMINGMGPSHPLAPSEEQMIAAFNTASHPSA